LDFLIKLAHAGLGDGFHEHDIVWQIHFIEALVGLSLFSSSQTG
jgi:hypothetical protein